MMKIQQLEWKQHFTAYSDIILIKLKNVLQPMSVLEMIMGIEFPFPLGIPWESRVNGN